MQRKNSLAMRQRSIFWANENILFLSFCYLISFQITVFSQALAFLPTRSEVTSECQRRQRPRFSSDPPRTPTTLFSSSSSMTTTAELGSTTIQMPNYDIVKVDLEDGRDYPIYIGTRYSDEEGEFWRLLVRLFNSMGARCAILTLFSFCCL